MNILQAIILGIVEGITEYLPISSTGHMLLTRQLMTITDEKFFTSFAIIIQLGAILAVVIAYGRSVVVDHPLMLRILVAFVPTGIIGLTLYQAIKHLLEGPIKNEIVLTSLAVGGLILIAFELRHREKDTDVEIEDLSKLPYWKCICIGLFQSIAMIPGVSRSAATVIGGMVLGMKRPAIVKFSFLLAIPTMTAATGMELYKNSAHFTADQAVVLGVGFGVSAVVALMSIELLLRYVRSNTFLPFGVYRVVAAILFWWLVPLQQTPPH